MSSDSQSVQQLEANNPHPENQAKARANMGLLSYNGEKPKSFIVFYVGDDNYFLVKSLPENLDLSGEKECWVWNEDLAHGSVKLSLYYANSQWVLKFSDDSKVWVSSFDGDYPSEIFGNKSHVNPDGWEQTVGDPTSLTYIRFWAGPAHGQQAYLDGWFVYNENIQDWEPSGLGLTENQQNTLSTILDVSSLGARRYVQKVNPDGSVSMEPQYPGFYIAEYSLSYGEFNTMSTFCVTCESNNFETTGSSLPLNYGGYYYFSDNNGYGTQTRGVADIVQFTGMNTSLFILDPGVIYGGELHFAYSQIDNFVLRGATLNALYIPGDVSNNIGSATIDLTGSSFSTLDMSYGTYSAETLNQIFSQLGPSFGLGDILITDCPGAATCDTSIATAKGYTVVS